MKLKFISLLDCKCRHLNQFRILSLKYNEIHPTSEQALYTEQDTIVDQYMKQYRLEGYFSDDSKFIQTSSDPAKLMFTEDIPTKVLQHFKNELIKNGLETEIDWWLVKSDLTGMNVNFDNIQRFEQKFTILHLDVPF